MLVLTITWKGWLSLKRKTIRLIFPEWQGGVNPNYATGEEIPALISPKGNQCETLIVPVAKDFDKKLEFTDGFYEKTSILAHRLDVFSAFTQLCEQVGCCCKISSFGPARQCVKYIKAGKVTF